jgi:RNA polymerase sigma-70 factor (ECF subfamily)
MGADPPDHEPSYEADLALARACAAGDPTALQRFEREHLAQVGAFVAHIDRGRDFVDELCQHLRDKLFVASASGPGKIAAYRGRGPLGGWLRVVAVRAALDLKRAQDAPPGDAEIPLDAAGSDPELDLIKAHYRRELADAFSATLRALPPEERTVLRLHALEGCTIDELAALYGVHRATAARWIDGARERLLEETRRLLGERLRLPAGEVDSVLGLLRSRVELSLQPLLSR